MNKQEELLTEIRDTLKKMEESEYSKDRLLETQIKSANVQILDYEVSIEVAWKVLNQAQKDKEKFLAEIEENCKKIQEIKDMTPLPKDWKNQIAELRKRNTILGKTEAKAKNGDTMWAGEVLQKDIKIEQYRNEISNLVGKREYTKTKLSAMVKLKVDGWEPKFEEFQDKILAADAALKPVD